MITSLTARPTSGGQWLLSWTSDAADAEFRIFSNGLLVGTTTELSFTVAAAAGSVFEVLDDPEAEPAASYPPTAFLTWYGSDDPQSYRVQQSIDAVWTTVATIAADGEDYFTWRSAVLEDGVVHDFRVVAVSAAGNDSTPVELSMLMVRHPDIPSVRSSYNAGTGVMTISAA